MKFLMIILLALLASCTKAKPAPAADAGLPAAENVSAYDAEFAVLVARSLKDNFDSDGQIAVRKPDGSFDDQGDGFVFTGLALAAFDCPTGAPLLTTILQGIKDHGGMIPSHDPLIPTDRITSRDQATGVMFGLVERWRRCPADRAAIATTWALHVKYVMGNNGNLGPIPDADMLTLRWLWGIVGQSFGVAGAGGGSKPEFEAGLVTTAAAINAQHSACYPIHLATMQAIMAAKLGSPMVSKDLFCAATRGMELPLTSWFCGQASADSWLSQFKPDVWVNINQRCPAWEQPPDAAGNESPSTDFFEVYRLAQEG